MYRFKILLIEDELDWQDILQESINFAFQGYESEEYLIQVVGTYEEGKIALERNNSWNLVVADITLDAVRHDLGKAWGRSLVRRAQNLRIPTIIVSGTTDARDVRNLLKECEVEDCFLKSDFAAFEQEFINAVRDALKLVSSMEETGESLINKLTGGSGSSIDILQRGYALLVGIAAYSFIPQLAKSSIDAQDLKDTLEICGYPQENIRLLQDQAATKAAINQALNWLSNQARDDDTVIIFFSGHGLQCLGGFSPGEYLCPVEADVNNLVNSCISGNEFATALNSIQAGRLVVFLDSCHSGGIGAIKNMNQLKSGLSNVTYDHLAQAKGRVIISSCKANEVSWELEDMRNGLFTHYLLEGLRMGAVRIKDGAVTITRLFEYISDKVPQHDIRCLQHPFMRSATENFVIAITK
jgi:DNA-binding NarL/FixJ family response regulator